MPNPNAKTTAVTVTLTLTSTADGPPYNISGCSTLVTYDNSNPDTLPGWGDAHLASPQANGASFGIVLADTNAPPKITSVLNWALTCIPRAGTTAASPFNNNAASITGSGSTSANGGFTLNFGNGNSNNGPKIQNAGAWDWSLMVQIVCTDGGVSTVKCFGSDPEMEVGP